MFSHILWLGMQASDRNVRVLDGHNGAVHAIRMTSDGAYCLTASADRTVKLWNPHKSDPSKPAAGPAEHALCVQTYSGAHGYPILDIAVTQDKSRFASCGEDKTAFLWDVASQRVLRRIQAHSHRINALAFNKYDTVLFTASYDRTVKAWDLRTPAGREPMQTMDDFKDSVTCIACTDYSIVTGSVDGTVRIYDLRRGLQQADPLGGDPITSLAISPDQRTYLTAQLGTTGRLRLVDLSDGKLLQEYSGHTHSSFKQEAAFEYGDQSVVTGSEDGSLHHYSLLSGRCSRVTQHAHFKAVSSVACHPSMGMVLSASYDGMAKVWTSSIS